MSTWASVDLGCMRVTGMQNHINPWYFKRKERTVETSEDVDFPVRYLYKGPVEVIARRLALDPDGHPKLPHLWPVKLLQAGQGGL